MVTFIFLHAFTFSSFLGLRLKVDKHSMQWTKMIHIWWFLLLQQAKHCCWLLAKKACFCKLQLFRFFFSAKNESQPTIFVDCIDHCKHNLLKIVSCLSDWVFFLSYCYVKSTLWDTMSKPVLLPWKQETQTSLCLSSFMATSVMTLILSTKADFQVIGLLGLPSHLNSIVNSAKVGTFFVGFKFKH